MIDKTTFIDIATFEHYTPHWDEVILDIISSGSCSCYSVEEYFSTMQEATIFLDAISYYGYVSFDLPNITVEIGSKYIDRPLLITKDEYLDIIHSRSSAISKTVTYKSVLDTLKSNLISHLENVFGFRDSIDVSLVYDIIARDTMYATKCSTHLTLETIEDYCLRYSHSVMHYDIYRLDNIESFDPSLHDNMLVFVTSGSIEEEGKVIKYIMSRKDMSIELLSLNSSPDMPSPFLIITIYPEK